MKLKYHFLIWGAVIFLTSAFFPRVYSTSAEVQAALSDNLTKTELGQMAGETGSNTYLKTFTGGAIVNAEKDTLALPNFLSNYQLQIQATRTAGTGTHNVKVYLDESCYTAGTANWRVIDSTTTTTATLGFIRQAVTYGLRHRIRMSGTGTQSSTYTVAVVGKKLN
jgi:hypothetical protein